MSLREWRRLGGSLIQLVAAAKKHRQSGKHTPTTRQFNSYARDAPAPKSQRRPSKTQLDRYSNSCLCLLRNRNLRRRKIRRNKKVFSDGSRNLLILKTLRLPIQAQPYEMLPSRPPVPAGANQSSKHPQQKSEPLSGITRRQLGALPLLNHLTVVQASMKRLRPAIQLMWTCPPMRMCLAAASNLCVVPVHLHLPLLMTVICVTGSHKTENCYRRFG